MTRPLTVALTGGIGSGKSAACAEFAALGVPVIDADEISHALTRPGAAAFAPVVELFGPAVVGADGALRRDLLREQVFRDPDLRGRLESIVHPLVYAEIRRRLAALDSPYCIVCIPLLLERGDPAAFDRVLVVDAPEDLQLARVAARDGRPATETREIIASQATRAQRLACADDVICNDRGLAQLRARVAELHSEFLAQAGLRVAGPA